MELKELNEEERLVLVAALKYAVLSDGVVSEDEAGTIGEIVEAFGQDVYRELMKTVLTRVHDSTSFQDMLGTVTRKEAQELIYGTILEVAISESIDTGESGLLGQMAAAWGVEAQIEQPELHED